MKKRYILLLSLILLIVSTCVNWTIQPEGKYIGEGTVIKSNSNTIEILDGEIKRIVVLPQNSHLFKEGDYINAWGYRWDSEKEVYGATQVKKQK